MLVGCPLKTLHRVSASLAPRSTSLGPLTRPRTETLTLWLHVLLPGLFPPVPSSLGPPASLYLSTKASTAGVAAAV